MTLTFYYAPMSTASVTDIVIEELAIPCKRIKVDIRGGGTRTPEYLKINPNGHVPTIVHDDTAIWESAAITLYLGETFGVEKKLYPAPGPKRGEAMKWVAWSNVTLGETIRRWSHNTHSSVPAEQQNAHSGATGLKDLKTCLTILDQELSRKSYLLGEFSIVDAHINAFMDWLSYMKFDFTSYSSLVAWRQRCSARPAYAKVMSAEQS